LERLRKHTLDRVARGQIAMVEASRQRGVSRSRLYELKDRCGEAGLLSKPRPQKVHPATVSPAVRDQIIAYAVEHPTEGPRSIAGQLRKPRFGAWRVSHATVYNVLKGCRTQPAGWVLGAGMRGGMFLGFVLSRTTGLPGYHES
jgi:Homeodomain-like domain